MSEEQYWIRNLIRQMPKWPPRRRRVRKPVVDDRFAHVELDARGPTYERDAKHGRTINFGQACMLLVAAILVSAILSQMLDLDVGSLFLLPIAILAIAMASLLHMPPLWRAISFVLTSGFLLWCVAF